MSNISPGIRNAIKRLKGYYGPPEPPPSNDPFELILFENVAYLATPSQRRESFEQLKRSVGTTPGAIMGASKDALESVTGRGVLKGTFAAKLRECASIAINDFEGDLGTVISGPIDVAKRSLRKFPGIGEPGAEKILLFAGLQPFLAPESNGLRVLTRLGFIEEEKSYARTYAASREIAKDLPQKPAALLEAHLLLQIHGQTLCKRNVPRCDLCPLFDNCQFAIARRSVSK